VKLLRKPEDERSDRDFDNERLPIASMLVFTLPVRAALCPDVRLIVEAGQIVGMDIGLEDDTASIATVTPVGPAPRNEFLPAKAATTVATIPGLGVNAHVIDELHLVIKPQTAGTRKLWTRTERRLVTFS
jgi:hypothetical protein